MADCQVRTYLDSFDLTPWVDDKVYIKEAGGWAFQVV